MISKGVSTGLADDDLERTNRWKSERVMASFFRVMERTSLTSFGWDPAGPRLLRNMHETLGLSQPVGVWYGYPGENRPA
jgi:hypothetical protein